MSPADLTITEETKLKVLRGILPLLEEARDISSQWNGDEPGHLEDQAHICDEIFKTAEKLQNLIKELEE